MKVEIFNKKNEKTGQIELSESVFGRKWNADLVHQVLVSQMANIRKPFAHAKGRGEVSGGGKKPWRQKGTGRARHGSIRSPIWIGGGVTFGPTKEKNYSKKINKKMRRVAIFAILSKKLDDGEIKFIDSLEIESPKTKILAGVLKNISEGAKSALLVPSVGSKNIYKAAVNIPKIFAIDPRSLNVYDLLRYKMILIDKKAAETVEEHYKINKASRQ